ncbi:hypothetical protein OsI_38586 [Oryza sativa Indica Group]|uniref:Uncharacterized protein n=1 Tax=Oryza sativa subsp. indica TaxID=39946 RepID=B8BMA2_ORYSI|nr:hypothetical protein OsI_38586 [Oryza sativa Indica Group]
MTMHQQNMNLHEQSNAKKTRTGTKKPKKRMDPTMKSIYKDLQQTMDADTGNVHILAMGMIQHHKNHSNSNEGKYKCRVSE